MEGQNNNVVPPVGGEIASPTPNPEAASAQNVTIEQKPVFETPSTEAPAAQATPAPAPAPAPNPTAQFAQSTVGSPMATPQNASFASTPVAQPVATQSVVAPVPGKKGGAGKIIAVIVVLLLLIGGGLGAFFFYRAHESNERVLSDALMNAISNGARSTLSTVSIEAEGTKIELTLDSTTNKDAEGFLSLSAKFTSDEYNIPETNAKLEAIEGKDALYVRVADYGNVASTVGKVSGDSDVEYQLSAIFNSVGDSWYEIPYSLLGTEYKKAMDCTREFSQEFYNGAYKDELTESFKENPFITIDGKAQKADGYKLYKIKIDEDLAEKFGKSLEDSNMYKDIQKCYESTTSYKYQDSSLKDNIFKNILGDGKSTANQTIVADDWDDYDTDSSWGYSSSADLDDFDIYFGITFWKHELVYASLGYDKNDVNFKAEINFKEAGDVQIPSNAKSLEELESTIENSVGGSSSRMETYYKEFCTKEKNYSGYESEEACKAAVDAQFGGSSDFDSLLRGLSI